MIKKILIGIVIVYTLFILSGIGLLYFAKIEKFTFLPGYSIKHTINKKGIVATDGPIILYKDGKVLSVFIQGIEKSARIYHDSILSQPIFCQSFQTGDRFSIQLKDSLKTEKDSYAMPEKILVLSDIEGNFKGLKMILQGTGVVNKKFDWTFGNGHLILNGDFFDRGTDVTACLWLIYRLEEQARLAGGKVHFILGNHEIMNLTGKLHYLDNRYKANADALNIKYEDWYSNDTELGRWLRTKNVIEKIGDVLYMHAGLSPEVAARALSLTDINNIARKLIDKNKDTFTKNDKIITGKNGPYWYRGIAQEDIEQNELDRLLHQYGANKMIIGHTILGDIKAIYKGKVIVIDLPHQENSDKGIMQALWYENKMFYVIDHQHKTTPLNN